MEKLEICGKVGTDITTNGFIKKTQETPRREIKLTKLYRKDYLERVKNNE